ncbi:alpha-1,6-mannosyl-glycoprotein 2-beta-N-acetylglucosaminyltransferase-like [Spea bombifrons]|uniref:alpha-1,6-mannosyl-glycoprotein 2-beta-N-acetylglucosaminyltransferase-like n=1 Tax=Spea bombifrons TaxID=233779 RepID=UPI002349CE24|nr:alpha-1,6-mannosyl-glycoprotein 2-beta-N-acetylglucosaminyltransferase-like [Spea bombifrons]
MRLKLHKKKIVALLLLLGVGLCVCLLFLSATPDQSPTLVVPSHPAVRKSHSAFQLPRGSLLQMRLSAYRNNLHQPVLNGERFPGRPDLVVVVQVRGGPGIGPRLRLLAESLKAAGPGATSRLLLVLSMEKPCPEAAEAMKSIDFCQVLPIYFPYSLSFYPYEFPGADPADCPRDLPRESAALKGCRNAEHPDSHGHYREAAFTMDKHHWWWKLHFTWERLRDVSGHGGHVVFIEEGSYLLPDWLHMLRLMQAQCLEDGCQLLSLGGTAVLEPSADPQHVELSGWVAPKHRSAVAMPREVYYQLMGCLAEFCTYDDYNWDWSLQHVSAACLPHPLKVLSTRLPRVLTLPANGACGRAGPCDNTEEASQALRAQVRELGGRLFPRSLIVAVRQQEARNPPQAKNGGWGDVRDHALCRSYARL